jgi:opacity protein-like surface antigen
VPDNFLHNGVGTDRTGFAWQVGAGATYPVAENISIGLGYRYFESIGLNREVVYGKETAYMTADGDNHAVIAEVVFGLD